MSKRVVAVGLPLILSVALFASPRFAGAADLLQPRIIVGNGTPESCTETALQDAVTTARLGGGGSIKFRCGPDPVTIDLTVQSLMEPDFPVTVILPPNTTIDGEDKITLASALGGGGSAIYVEPGAPVTLKNLTLDIGKFSYARPLWNAGTLTLQKATVLCRGGNCLDNKGSLRITNSAISGATVSFMLMNTGTLVVRNTAFFDNRFGIAIINISGTATIDASSFVRTNGEGWGGGGAILNGGTLTVTGTQFSNNGSGGASAIGNYSSGTLVVKNSTFSDNVASFGAGAIGNSGQATIDNCQFVRNRVSANYGGGAISNSGTLNIRNTGFSDNFAPFGAALFNSATGTLTVDSSTFSGNTAHYGGAIANGGLVGTDSGSRDPNGGELRIRNSVITNNAASELGGGIYNYGAGTVKLDSYTTVTDNTPDDIFP